MPCQFDRLPRLIAVMSTPWIGCVQEMPNLRISQLIIQTGAANKKWNNAL
jgi:hypothetical protein